MSDYGPTPPAPEGTDPAVADAAWAQSNGSMAAYYLLLKEAAAGEDAEVIAPGDKRLSATGGETYGDPPEPPAEEPPADPPPATDPPADPPPATEPPP